MSSLFVAGNFVIKSPLLHLDEGRVPPLNPALLAGGLSCRRPAARRRHPERDRAFGQLSARAGRLRGRRAVLPL